MLADNLIWDFTGQQMVFKYVHQVHGNNLPGYAGATVVQPAMSRDIKLCSLWRGSSKVDALWSTFAQAGCYSMAPHLSAVGALVLCCECPLPPLPSGSYYEPRIGLSGSVQPEDRLRGPTEQRLKAA